MMRKLCLVIGCIIAPLTLAATTPTLQPFGISFGDTRSTVTQGLTEIDCRMFNSAPMCRYQPVSGSLFAYYEVQYTALSQRIVSVMGTSKVYTDHFACQSAMLQINQFIRAKYKLDAAGYNPQAIVYDKPPISMLCTANHEFHIIYRNPTLSAAQIETEIRQSTRNSASQQYADQF